MQVKTFEAVDMKQALVRVREELGPNAVIVSSRPVKRDAKLFGLLGRKVLEITAAIEDSAGPEPLSPSGTGGSLRGSGRRVYHEIRAVKQAMDPVLDEVRAIRETVATIDERVGPDPSELNADLSQIRVLLASLVGTAGLGSDTEGGAAQRLYYFLLARGVDDPLARGLVQRVVTQVDPGSLGDLERLKLNLAAEMRSDLSRAERGSPPGRVQVFVGPTGVGKTTTIAKLAARAERSDPGKSLIITTDVHRVAAVEQMVRFGEIVGVDVEVAISPEDLARTIASASDRERIFIDTTGRSHRDPSTLRGIRKLIDALPADELEVMLVLSATTRAADSREILSAYHDLPCSRLILTKLDETRVYGELYNCVARSQRPIACVTHGQAVPESLSTIDIPGILRNVLHGQGAPTDA